MRCTNRLLSAASTRAAARRAAGDAEAARTVTAARAASIRATARRAEGDGVRAALLAPATGLAERLPKPGGVEPGELRPPLSPGGAMGDAVTRDAGRSGARLAAGEERRGWPLRMSPGRAALRSGAPKEREGVVTPGPRLATRRPGLRGGFRGALAADAAAAARHARSSCLLCRLPAGLAQGSC